MWVEKKTIKFDFLGTKIEVYICPKDINGLVKSLNETYAYNMEELKDGEEYSGVCFDISDTKIKPISIIVLRDRTTSLVVHEAVHASWQVLDYHEINIDKDNDEIQAYFVDYLTKRILNNKNWEKLEIILP